MLQQLQMMHGLNFFGRISAALRHSLGNLYHFQVNIVADDAKQFVGCRYLGTAAEPCSPVPLIIYLICHSSSPKAMSKCYAQAAEVLQGSPPAPLHRQAENFEAQAGSSNAQADSEQVTEVGSQANQKAAGKESAADLQANYKVIVERKGSVGSQKQLGSLIIQVSEAPVCVLQLVRSML